MKISIIGSMKTVGIKVAGMKGIKPLCVGAVVAALPVYLVSDALFKTAILRDRSSSFLEKNWMKKLLCKMDGWCKQTKNRKQPDGKSMEVGLRFSDFRAEIENGKKWFQEQDKERIRMSAGDGVKLVAYYLPAAVESKKVLILMHGYRKDGLSDFAGLVRFYHEMGYHLLVPHQRSHGESEGDYICFGVKERYDLKQWTEYIVKRFEGECSIFLTGISMGGATVLMTAGLGLPKQVKGMIADCAFTSPWEMFECVLKRDCHLPVFPFLYVADRISRRKAGFGFKECSTISCMKTNQIPVLFIHGGKDDFVPMEMSSRNYDACAAKKKFLMIDRAAHGTSHLAEPEVYHSTVMEFMEKCENGC